MRILIPTMGIFLCIVSAVTLTAIIRADGSKPIVKNVMDGIGPGEYFSQQEPTLGLRGEAWINVNVLPRYQTVKFTSVKWATETPSHGFRLTRLLFSPSTVYIVSVGVTPHGSPVRGSSLTGAQQGSFVFEYRFEHPGLYRFDRPTVTGIAYPAGPGKQTPVRFSQTFHDNWGFCVGYSDRVCDKKRTERWIEGRREYHRRWSR